MQLSYCLCMPYECTGTHAVLRLMLPVVITHVEPRGRAGSPLVELDFMVETGLNWTKKKQSLADAQAQNCSGRFDRPPEEQWSLGVGSGRGQFSRLPSEHRAAALWDLNKKPNIFTYTSLWMTFLQTQFSGGSEWWSESVGFGEISLLWDNTRAAQRTKSESDY